MIGKDGAPLPHGFGAHGALVGTQPKAGKTVRQFSVGLFSYQLVGEVGAPKIDTRDLEELARRLTEELD